MIRPIVAFCLILLACPNVFAEEQKLEKLPRNKMVLGGVYEIKTKEALYRATVTDVKTGEVSMTQYKNGVTSPPLKVFLVGSSQGPQHPSGGLALVFMWEIRVGLKMELGVRTMEQQDRWFTAEVEAIRFLGNDDVRSAGRERVVTY